MWTCAQLKDKAKSVLSRKYWSSLVAILIVIGIVMGIMIAAGLFTGIISVIVTIAGFVSSGPESIYTGLRPAGYDLNLPFRTLVTVFFSAVSAFTLAPLGVGLVRYFLRSRHEDPDYGTLFFAFKKGVYLKIVGTLLWVALFTFLWGLPGNAAGYLMRHLDNFVVLQLLLRIAVMIFLFIVLIAGAVLSIWKSISYSMTTYILSDNPSIGYRRALKLSIGMTRGHVGHIFVLGLSFIGWFLLGALACGVGILFVLPYLQATMAELYARLRENALRSRICTFAELGFDEPDPSFYAG